MEVVVTSNRLARVSVKAVSTMLTFPFSKFCVKSHPVLIKPCCVTPCKPPMLGIGLRGLVSSSCCAIPTVQTPAFTKDNFGDFRRLGPYIERPEPFPASNIFAGFISTHDFTVGLLASSVKFAVNTDVRPGLASRPLVVSPPSATGATEIAPSDLISFRTRHSAATSAESPRATADYYGFSRQPEATAPPTRSSCPQGIIHRWGLHTSWAKRF